MLFQRNTEVYNARQSRDLHVAFTRSSMYSKTIRFKGVFIWNQIAGMLDSGCSIFICKNKNKALLLSNRQILVNPVN